MAHPLNNEEEIFQKIRDKTLRIDTELWGLINHHVRNDLMVISMKMGTLAVTPRWILRVASWIIRVLHKLSRQPGKPPKELTEICSTTMETTKSIDILFREIRSAMNEKNDL